MIKQNKEQAKVIMIEGIPIKYFSKEEIDLIFKNPKILDIIKIVKAYKKNTNDN